MMSVDDVVIVEVDAVVSWKDANYEVPVKWLKSSVNDVVNDVVDVVVSWSQIR